MNINSVIYQKFIAFFFDGQIILLQFLAQQRVFLSEVLPGTYVDFVYNPLQPDYSSQNIKLRSKLQSDFASTSSGKDIFFSY